MSRRTEKTVTTSVSIPEDARIAYSYRRVSDASQEETQNGLEAQAKMNGEYYERNLKGTYGYGGDFIDSAVSARKNDFRKRKAGAALDTILCRGDCVIISRIDRAFRSLQDFSTTMAHWQSRGIGVVFVANGIDTADSSRRATNKLVMGILAAVAEWESDMISTRTKEGMAAKKARGEHSASSAPFGKVRAGKRLRYCTFERPIMGEIVRLRDVEGWSFYRIFCYLRKNGVTRRDGKPWEQRSVHQGYKREKQWQEEDAKHAAAIAEHHRNERRRLGLDEELDANGDPPFEV